MRASGDVGPNFLLASKASLMALEASGRVVLWRKVGDDRNIAAFLDVEVLVLAADEAKASVAAGRVQAKPMKATNFMTVTYVRIGRYVTILSTVADFRRCGVIEPMDGASCCWLLVDYQTAVILPSHRVRDWQALLLQACGKILDLLRIFLQTVL